MLPAPAVPPLPRRARSRRGRYARRLLVLAGLALVLSSCSSNHGPKDYNDVVQANFVNSCNETNTAKKDVPDPLQFCECVYAKVKDTYTFAEFKVLDQKLRDALADTKNAPKTPADLAKIDARYVSEVDSCRTAGPAAPGAGGSTSTTLATTTTTK